MNAHKREEHEAHLVRTLLSPCLSAAVIDCLLNIFRVSRRTIIDDSGHMLDPYVNIVGALAIVSVTVVGIFHLVLGYIHKYLVIERKRVGLPCRSMWVGFECSR